MELINITGEVAGIYRHNGFEINGDAHLKRREKRVLVKVSGE